MTHEYLFILTDYIEGGGESPLFVIVLYEVIMIPVGHCSKKRDQERTSSNVQRFK